MADLTPDLLAQLETLAGAATPGPWRAEIGNFNKSRGTVLTSAPVTESWSPPQYTPIAVSHLFSERHAEDWTFIAAMSPEVVLALVAAAKERDQLRAEVATHDEQIAAIMDGTFSVGDGTAQKEIERLRAELEKIAGSSLGGMRREVAQLRDMLASAKAEIADVRGALDAHGHDGTREAAAKLYAEATQLRAYLEEARQERNALQQRALQLRSHATALLACIDRKSYSSAAQQEAVRAAEAAIGSAP